MQGMATVIWKKKQRFVSQKGKCKAFQERVRSEVWINGSHPNADVDLYPSEIPKGANFLAKLHLKMPGNINFSKFLGFYRI